MQTANSNFDTSTLWYNTPVLACLLAILELTIPEVPSGKYDYTPATLSGTVQDVLDIFKAPDIAALEATRPEELSQTPRHRTPQAPAENLTVTAMLPQSNGA